MKSRRVKRSKKKSRRHSTRKLTRSRASLAETSNKYANRPSPPYKANEYCGKTMQGNDGGMYLSKKGSNGVCRWIPVNGKRSRKGSRRSSFLGKRYKTLENGREPYLVVLNGSDVQVMIGEKVDPNYCQEVYSVKAEEVFVGDSKPSYDEGYYEWKKGTTILLKVKPNRYVLI